MLRPRRLIVLAGVLAGLIMVMAPTVATAGVTIDSHPVEPTSLYNSEQDRMIVGGTGSLDFLDFQQGVDVYVHPGTGPMSDDAATAVGHLEPGFIFDITYVIPIPTDRWGGEFKFAHTLPDGKYFMSVYQRDLFGVHSRDALASRQLVLDTVAPDTVIDSHPPAFSNDTTPEFTFHAEDPAPSSGATLECKLDGAATWSACTSPYETPARAEGTHTLEVRARDYGNGRGRSGPGGGNYDSSPASYSWTIDTTPPDLSIGGISPKQRFLKHATIPATVSCTDPLSGGVRSGLSPSGVTSSTAPPECNPSAIDNEELGPHYFEVTATDRAGNSSTKALAYVIDPPRYADFVLKDHPLAYYRLGDPLGSDQMADSSGHGYNGEYKNGIALRRLAAIACQRRPHPPRACELGADPQDYAAYFPERDGYGFANNIPAPTDAYTMEAWVKPAGSNNMMVMSHGGGGQLFISGGHLAFRQTQDTIFSSGSVPPGQWSHVAATWDGHDTYLYVNGVQVAHSANANKPPSGTATFYVGYGEMAPWFHGTIDEAAYYDSAVSAHMLHDHYEIGAAYDHPSIQAGNSPFNTQGPFTDPVAPKNGGLYAPGKVPAASFSCTDPDDVPGDSDIASCTATVDGNPIASGEALPDSLGTHEFLVTAIDEGGNEYLHPHTYTVKPFKDILLTDNPIAYYRLGDGVGETMADSSSFGRDGIYKNDQESGPVGVAGDGDHARRFFGAGGYGYVNGIPAPRFQSTLEAWVNPDDVRNESIAGHGDAGELLIENGRFVFRHMDQRVIASVGPTPGSWSQVVGVWDGVDISIYVDGVLCGTQEATKRPSSVSTFYVGYGELAPWFKGAIDEVAYYDIALPPARVYQHFLADPPPADLSVTASSADQGSGSSEPTGSGGSSGSAGPAAGPAASTGSSPSTGTAGPSAAAPHRKSQATWKQGKRHRKHKQRRHHQG